MRRYSSRAGGSQHLLRHSARHLQQGRKPKSVCRQQSASIPSALLSTAGRTRCGDTATLVGERVLGTAARAATIISDAVGMAGCANFSPMDDTSRLASELPFQRLGRLTPNPAQFYTGPVSSARYAGSHHRGHLVSSAGACCLPHGQIAKLGSLASVARSGSLQEGECWTLCLLLCTTAYRPHREVRAVGYGSHVEGRGVRVPWPCPWRRPRSLRLRWCCCP